MSKTRIINSEIRPQMIGKYLHGFLTYKIRGMQYKRLFELVVLAFLIFMGLAIRFDDIYSWHDDSARIFIGNEPTLSTSDGYYYLTLAKDIIEDTYESIDKKRVVPDYRLRPSPPPLLSSIAGFISKYTSISLNWVAVSLPVFLGVLLVVPLFAIGKYFGGAAMALAAVAIGLSSASYLFKTTLGMFDTDCLNVFFTLTISFCFLKFADITNKDRYIYFILGLGLFGLFYIWWDQAPKVTIAITLFPMLYAIIVFYRPERPEMVFFLTGLTICLAFLAITDVDFFSNFPQTIKAYYNYIAKQKSSWFPQTSIAITEQAKLSFKQLVEGSTNSLLGFGLSIIGVVGIAVRHPKKFIFFLAPVALALLPYFFSRRFMIFSVPLIALGTGFSAELIWRKSKNNYWSIWIAPALVLYLTWSNISFTKGGHNFSIFSIKTISGLQLAHDKTPRDSVIWSSCSNGYLINYWARRTSMCDGQFHDGERSVYNAIPLVATDYKLAANYIRFFVIRGEKGIRQVYKVLENDRDSALKLIKEILAAGPQKSQEIISSSKLVHDGVQKNTSEWMAFFYPDSSLPVYMFIDWRMILQSRWLLWYGTWEVDKYDGLQPLPAQFYFNARMDGDQIDDFSRSMRVDTREGNINMSGTVLPFQSATINRINSPLVHLLFDSDEVEVLDGDRYSIPEIRSSENIIRKGRYHFEFNEEFEFAAFVDQNLSRTVYFQLFWKPEPPAPEYFKPVIQNTPHFQLWEVIGD